MLTAHMLKRTEALDGILLVRIGMERELSKQTVSESSLMKCSVKIEFQRKIPLIKSNGQLISFRNLFEKKRIV